MTNQRHQLEVNGRTESGRKFAKQMRLQGLIPGVIYGKHKAPQSVSVNGRTLSQLLRSDTGEHGLLDVNVVADKKADAWKGPVLIKDVQHDVVSGHVLHIDFQAVDLKEKVHVPVSIVLTGEAIGVKQDGGVVEHFMREIDLECLPTDIPEHITVDITELNIGDSVHVSDLVIPAGAKVLSDMESVLVTVQAPRKEEAAEDSVEEVAEGGEPEVIREKKEEGGKAEGSGAADKK